MSSYPKTTCDCGRQSSAPALGCMQPGCGMWLSSDMTPAGGDAAPSREGPRHDDFAKEAAGPGGEPASAAAPCLFIGVSLVFDALKWCAPSLLAAISTADQSRHNLEVIKQGLAFGSGVHLFIGIVMLLYLMRRAWRAVQPAAQLGGDLRIPKPGRAVWLLLIPLFNCYWVFIACKNLMDAANALRAERRLPCRPFCSETAGLFAGVFIAATVLPSLSWFMIMPLSHHALSVTLGLQFAIIADWYCDLNPLPQIAAAVAWYLGRLLLLPIACDVARIINTLR
jgi:hypothetical protein